MPSITTSSRATGSAGPSRSAHSTRTTPSSCRSSRSPPAMASAASSSRYRSRWNIGSRPSYSVIRTKVGELTVSVIPSPAANPFANCVLPAPRSPTRHSRSPGRATAASRAASARVAAGSVVVMARSARRDVDIAPRVAEHDVARGCAAAGQAEGARPRWDPDVSRSAPGRRAARPLDPRRRSRRMPPPGGHRPRTVAVRPGQSPCPRHPRSDRS